MFTTYLHHRGLFVKAKQRALRVAIRANPLFPILEVFPVEVHAKPQAIVSH